MKLMEIQRKEPLNKPTTHCTFGDVEGLGGVCLLPTREGKPFCPEHIYMLPYAAQVLALQTQVERDLETLRKAPLTGGKGPALPESSPLVIDMLLLLRQGVTVGKLTRHYDLSCEHRDDERIVCLMRRLGYKFLQTQRSWVLSE